MALDEFVPFRALCHRSALPRSSQLVSCALLLGLLAACGADAEGRYAGLSSAEVSAAELTYKIRFLSPPWKRVDTDPLVTGARKSVPVGGRLRDVVPDSGLVLAIDRESSIDDMSGLTYAKYVMEVVAVRCSASELTEDDSCARFLAASDYAARAESEDSGFFGTEEQLASNDVGQKYYELMTRDPVTYRYRRLAFFETGDRLLTVRLYIDANPGLADPATSRMIQTLEIMAPAGAEP